MNKKGLSPVIATVILISIALILAVIIFLWARSVLTEKAQKFDEPVEYACERVSFDADIRRDTADTTSSKIIVDIVNRGDVPIYKLILNVDDGDGNVDVLTSNGNTVSNGATGSYTFDDRSGTSFKVIPVIVGQAGDVKKAYTCEEQYGKDLEI